MELVDTEMADLTSHGTYVAGFTDASIEARTELYDLFINGNLIFQECTGMFKLYFCFSAS